MKLSLIIPSKNEEFRLIPHVPAMYKLLQQSFKDKFEIIIVINNTTDHSESLLRRLKTQNQLDNLHIYNMGKASGKGDAVFFGVEKSKGEIVGFIDADGSSPTSELFKLYNYLEEHNTFDAVISSRYIKGSKITGGLPLFRFFLSRMFNLTAQFLFGLPFKDTQCGLKLFRAHAIKTIKDDVVAKGWTFDVNILVALKEYGFKVKELPTKWIFKDGSKLVVHKVAAAVIDELSQILQNYGLIKRKGKAFTLQAK
jgi:glycosyltransferase involved in cell wall biosynthesis